MHAPLRVTLRHFVVHDAAAGGHPLHVAGAERAAIAQRVGVLHVAGQHVGDGLDAAMRMPREAGLVLAGHVVPEIVEQQERVGLGRFTEAKGAVQVHAGALHGGLGLDDSLDGTDGHQIGSAFGYP